ncbi:MAG: chemotaxis protein CheB [Methylomonas sp.]
MAKLAAIGFSAGGIPLIQCLLGALPADYPLPVVLVVHLPPETGASLIEIFQKVSPLPVMPALDKASIQPGHVYVALPDYHLLVEREGYFALSVDPPVKAVRPSIDVFLQSAAEVYEKHLIAVILSGANSDGAHGMAYVKALGGVTIVLDPMHTEFRVMPDAVIEATDVDYVASLDEIISLLKAVKDQP